LPKRPADLKPTAATPSGDVLEPFRHLLGTVGDHIVGEKAGVDRKVVGAYRRKLGIAAWDGFRSGPRKSSAQAAASAPAAAKAPEAARAPAAGPGPKPKAAPTAEPAPKAAAPAAQTKDGKRILPSKIDAFAHLLGTMTDAAVAQKVGLTVSAVAKYRTKRGLPGFAVGRPKDSGASKPKAPAAPAPVAAPAAPSQTPAGKRKSKLDGFVELLGTMPDSELADRVGVTRERVRQLRKRLGIASALSGDGRPTSPVAPTPAPAPAPVAAAAPVTVKVPARRGRPPAAAAPAAVVKAPEAPAVAVVAVKAPAPVAPAPVAEPVAAPVPVASAPAPVTLPKASGPHHLVFVEAGNAAGARTFAVIGKDLADALGSAQRAVALRTDGPWTLTSARLDCEALVGG
jgi:hypothetical protein